MTKSQWSICALSTVAAVTAWTILRPRIRLAITGDDRVFNGVGNELPLQEKMLLGLAMVDFWRKEQFEAIDDLLRGQSTRNVIIGLASIVALLMSTSDEPLDDAFMHVRQYVLENIHE